LSASQRLVGTIEKLGNRQQPSLDVYWRAMFLPNISSLINA
jgi:hypothetical protein